MTPYKIVIRTSDMKKTQEQMLVCMQTVQNAMLELKEGAEILAEVWKGIAANTFLHEFEEEREKTQGILNEMQLLIAILVQTEKEFQLCEKRIAKML